MTDVAEHASAEFVRRGYACIPYGQDLVAVLNMPAWRVDTIDLDKSARLEMTFNNWTDMVDWLTIGHNIVAAQVHGE